MKENTSRFWFLAVLVYASLIYSTCLHYAYGPNRSITVTYFTSHPFNEQYVERYPDQATFHDTHPYAEIYKNDFWKLGSTWGDNGIYLMQSESMTSTRPPYVYRVLAPMIVGMIASITTVSPALVFIYFNSILTLATALIFTIYLTRDLGFSRHIALIGGILFVTMVANTRTVPFPLVEPASFFWGMLVFLALSRKNALAFILASVGAVATKEVFVLAFLLWPAVHGLRRPGKDLLRTILISASPILAFMAIRLIFRGSVLDVAFGENPLAGNFKTIAHKLGILTTVGGFIYVSLGVFFSFSFFWAGIIHLKKHPFLFRASIVIPFAVFATMALSSRHSASLGWLFAIIIPSFLLFFENPQKSNEADLPPRSEDEADGDQMKPEGEAQASVSD